MPAPHDFPAASYDAWKLETPEEEHERLSGRRVRRDRDPDYARDQRIENERLDREFGGSDDVGF